MKEEALAGVVGEIDDPLAALGVAEQEAVREFDGFVQIAAVAGDLYEIRSVLVREFTRVRIVAFQREVVETSVRRVEEMEPVLSRFDFEFGHAVPLTVATSPKNISTILGLMPPFSGPG